MGKPGKAILVIKSFKGKKYLFYTLLKCILLCDDIKCKLYNVVVSRIVYVSQKVKSLYYLNIQCFNDENNVINCFLRKFNADNQHDFPLILK